MKMKKHELLMAIRILIKIYDDDKDEATLSVLRSLLNLYYDLPATSEKVREPLEGEIIGIDEQGQLLMVTKNGDIAKRHQAFAE